MAAKELTSVDVSVWGKKIVDGCTRQKTTSVIFTSLAETDTGSAEGQPARDSPATDWNGQREVGVLHQPLFFLLPYIAQSCTNATLHNIGSVRWPELQETGTSKASTEHLF